MNTTLSTPDPAAQVAEVREIIDNRGDHSCESTLLAIRRVIDPPGEAGPVEKDGKGWPLLPDAPFTDTGSGPGSAWERHDDPEL